MKKIYFCLLLVACIGINFSMGQVSKKKTVQYRYQVGNWKYFENDDFLQIQSPNAEGRIGINRELFQSDYKGLKPVFMEHDSLGNYPDSPNVHWEASKLPVQEVHLELISPAHWVIVSKPRLKKRLVWYMMPDLVEK